MVQINKLWSSAWSFDTSASGGGAVGGGAMAGVTGGKLYLKNPAGTAKSFGYGAGGGGVGVGLKFKGKGLPLGVAGGPASLPNTGKLYCTSNLPAGTEASESDLQGPCAIIELSAGILGGGSGTMMCLGCGAKYLSYLLVPMVGMGIAFEELANSAKVLLFIAGVNVGLQAGAGLMGYAGYLH